MLHPGLTITPITPAIAIASSDLPSTLHRDPADRLIIATARRLAIDIVTRGHRMLDYAGGGHVGVLAY